MGSSRAVTAPAEPFFFIEKARVSSAVATLRRLLKARLALSSVRGVPEAGELDADAARLFADIEQTALRLGNLAREGGATFDGEILALRNEAGGLWLDYREARDLKPARKKRRRTTAEYVRHYRERRRRGVRHVVQVEVTGDDLAALIERGLLTEAEAADRKSVAEVIEEKLVEFLRGGKKS
jgi:hypothetical protein